MTNPPLRKISTAFFISSSTFGALYGHTMAHAIERHTAFVTRLAELGMRLVGTAGYDDYSYAAGWHGALDLLPHGRVSFRVQRTEIPNWDKYRIGTARQSMARHEVSFASRRRILLRREGRG